MSQATTWWASALALVLLPVAFVLGFWALFGREGGLVPTSGRHVVWLSVAMGAVMLLMLLVGVPMGFFVLPIVFPFVWWDDGSGRGGHGNKGGEKR